MSSTVGVVVLLAVLSLTSVTLALECYKCKYDERMPMETTLEDDFYNTVGCNTGAGWDSTKPKRVTCPPEDNFCRAYTYTLNDKTIVERSCAQNCVINTVGVSEKRGSTTTLKKNFCCHGNYCNGVLEQMSTTTEVSTTEDANALSVCFFRLLLMCAAARFLW